jgi:predicted small metal-binding protein
MGGPERKLAIECNCGWEIHGSEHEIVVPTQEHVRDVHWQDVTREDVLEMAVPWEGDD